MTKIKICGLTCAEDMVMVNLVLPDYIGFVFAPSKRQVTPESAKRLCDLLNPTIKAVGVFVDSATQEIDRIARECNLDAVQLHGNESADILVALRGILPQTTQIIKAIKPQSDASIQSALGLPCDFLLFDTYCDDVAGGSGKQFNWDILKSSQAIIKSYFLAGGLNSGNIESALCSLHPYAVDISSGVESNSVKDTQKVYEIIQKVRNYNQ